MRSCQVLSMIIHKIVIIIISILSLNSHLNAQVFGSNETLKNGKSTSITVGYGAFSSPTYEGGNDYTIRAAPFLNVKYENISANLINGIRVNLVEEPSWSGGMGLGGSFGRYAKQDVHLSGLGNIDWTMEAILFAKYKTRFYSLTSEIYKDILERGHKGHYIKTSFGTGFPLINLATFFRPSLSITFADKNYLNSFFGVTSGQSSSSGHPEYSLNQGVKDVSATVLMISRINEKVSFTGMLSYKELIGSVAKSPIVQASGQFSGGFSIGYHY